MTPYTYLIGWSKQNAWYYGCRYASGVDPKDLWNPYKTSSKLVHNFIEIHGDPDVIEIRRTFSSPEEAMLWEERVLTKLDAKNNKMWLNQTNGNRDGIYANVNKSPSPYKGMSYEERFGEEKAKEIKNKISKSVRGTTLSPETREKLKNSSTQHKFKGMTLEERFGEERAKEIKAKMSKPKSDSSNMGKYKRTTESVNKLKQSRKGKATGKSNGMRRQENREKVANSKIGRKRVYNEDGSFEYKYID